MKLLFNTIGLLSIILEGSSQYLSDGTLVNYGVKPLPVIPPPTYPKVALLLLPRQETSTIKSIANKRVSDPSAHGFNNHKHAPYIVINSENAEGVIKYVNVPLRLPDYLREPAQLKQEPLVHQFLHEVNPTTKTIYDSNNEEVKPSQVTRINEPHQKPVPLKTTPRQRTRTENQQTPNRFYHQPPRGQSKYQIRPNNIRVSKEELPMQQPKHQGHQELPQSPKLLYPSLSFIPIHRTIFQNVLGEHQTSPMPTNSERKYQVTESPHPDAEALKTEYIPHQGVKTLTNPRILHYHHQLPQLPLEQLFKYQQPQFVYLQEVPKTYYQQPLLPFHHQPLSPVFRQQLQPNYSNEKSGKTILQPQILTYQQEPLKVEQVLVEQNYESASKQKLEEEENADEKRIPHRQKYLKYRDYVLSDESENGDQENTNNYKINQYDESLKSQVSPSFVKNQDRTVQIINEHR